MSDLQDDDLTREFRGKPFPLPENLAKQQQECLTEGLNKIEIPEPKSETPETDQAEFDTCYQNSDGDWCVTANFARKLERERDEARVPLCVGKPIIQILAKEGQYLSDDKRGLIAADCLFRKDPYEELVQLRARAAELEKALADCYKLTGADPDGNEDWRLAPLAMEEVQRLRNENDELEKDKTRLMEELSECGRLARESKEGYIDDLPGIMFVIDLVTRQAIDAAKGGE